MAFCSEPTSCHRTCGRQDAHGGDCRCHDDSCRQCHPEGDVIRQHDWIQTYTHDWIQTYTSRAFSPTNPRSHDVVIDDIAHALSMQCRFTGHTREFYSVAQHAVLMTLLMPKELGIETLFHDNDEAYMLDIARPVKHHPTMAAYRIHARRVMRVIREAFGMLPEEPAEVKEADRRMLMTERRDLMGDCPTGHRWSETAEPYDIKIVPWTPREAEVAFLGLARELRPKGPEGDRPAWGSLRGTLRGNDKQLTFSRRLV